MKFAAVLNREGGVMRTTDLGAFSARMSEALAAEGHSVEIDIVSGNRLVAAIDKACSGSADIILVGGGDGTVSAAAARLMDSGKISPSFPPEP